MLRFKRPNLGCPNEGDRKSTRLNSSHSQISYAVFCLKKKNALAAEASDAHGPQSPHLAACRHCAHPRPPCFSTAPPSELPPTPKRPAPVATRGPLRR